MALKKAQSLQLKRLKNQEKKTRQTIEEFRKVWPLAIDRNFVERHIAKNEAVLSALQHEIKTLENLQVR